MSHQKDEGDDVAGSNRGPATCLLRGATPKDTGTMPLLTWRRLCFVIENKQTKDAPTRTDNGPATASAATAAPTPVRLRTRDQVDKISATEADVKHLLSRITWVAEIEHGHPNSHIAHCLRLPSQDGGRFHDTCVLDATTTFFLVFWSQINGGLGTTDIDQAIRGMLAPYMNTGIDKLEAQTRK